MRQPARGAGAWPARGAPSGALPPLLRINRYRLSRAISRAILGGDRHGMCGGRAGRGLRLAPRRGSGRAS